MRFSARCLGAVVHTHTDPTASVGEASNTAQKASPVTRRCACVRGYVRKGKGALDVLQTRAWYTNSKDAHLSM